MKTLWNRCLRPSGMAMGLLVFTALTLAACSGGGGSSSGGSNDNGGGGGGTAPCGDVATCQAAGNTVISNVFGAMSAAIGSSSANTVTLNNFPCTYGGDININGTYSGSDPTTTYMLSLMFNSCSFGTNPTTDALTINGTFNVTATANSTTGDGSYTFTSPNISVAGNSQGTPLNFSCAIDINMTINTSASPPFSYSSTVCGQTVTYP